jgi:2-keto-4-pentenoate hydratase/2-oxohepta-3-ene-1,7-dioic acid hydratase in catechol pathway
MKLLFFNDFRLGILKEDMVIDVSDKVQEIPHAGPHDIINGLIGHFTDYEKALRQAIKFGKGVPVADVKIRAPLPKPTTIVCMAVNYREGRELPPINAFLKTPNAIIGGSETMILPDVPATIFEGEAEIAVVIGRRASHVSQADAMKYVFGYINFVDGSARGLPPENNSFYQMKARDTFAPIGPYLVTADEIADPYQLQVRLWNNGVLMQNYNTADMANKIPRCIEWISSIHTLEPGDIVALGTNHRGLNPFMDGDQIEMEAEGLGRLHFKVRDDLKRTWARETRAQRQALGLPGTAPQSAGKYAKETGK